MPLTLIFLSHLDSRSQRRGWEKERCLGRYRRYPLKLVHLLESAWQREEAIAQLLTAPACTLDPFSLHFRNQYPSAAAISGARAQAELTIMLSCISATTYGTERLHSKNLRQKRSRTMTHTMDVNDVGVSHTARSAPHIAAALEKEPPCHKSRHAPAKRKVTEAQLTDGDQPIKSTARRGGGGGGGGGGAWRTFVQMEALARSEKALVEEKSLRAGRVLQSGLGQRYRGLSADQKNKLEVVGKQRTLLHRTILSSPHDRGVTSVTLFLSRLPASCPAKAQGSFKLQSCHPRLPRTHRPNSTQRSSGFALL